MSSCMHPDNDQPINPSGNSSIRDVIEAYTGRRNFLKGTLGAAAVMTAPSASFKPRRPT